MTRFEVFMRVRRLVLTALLASGFLLAPAHAGPGELPVGQGGRATPNVHLVANVPTGVGTGGAFLGSTYFQTSADTAWWYAGATQATTGGLRAFDVTDPTKPVPSGFLPLPHHENEDLTLSEGRHLAVISQQPWRTNPKDVTSPCQPGRVFVVDVSNPHAILLAGTVSLPAQVGVRKSDGRSLCGPGHTATLVDHDRYLWLSGSRDGRVHVVDLRDPSAPTLLGSFLSPAGAATPGTWTPGLVHDVDVDQYGDVWVTGSGGTAMYDLTASPLRPQLVAAVSPGDNLRAQQYIHHGSQRLDRDHVLVTEEDVQGSCMKGGKAGGSLQVWRIDRRVHRLVEVSAYEAPKGEEGSGLLRGCSSHWFTVNRHRVVADAWYGGGVRFLDLSDPRHPRPIGVWQGDSAIASQARFVPGRPDLVYVADYERGLDVVQIDAGGRGARTVTTADEKIVGGSPAPGLLFPVRLRAHEDFGWACAVPG